MSFFVRNIEAPEGLYVRHLNRISFELSELIGLTTAAAAATTSTTNKELSRSITLCWGYTDGVESQSIVGQKHSG